MEGTIILKWLFEKAAFVGLVLAFIGWIIGLHVIRKLHSAARVGKTKCDDCGNEYFEEDTVGNQVYKEYLYPNNGRDNLSMAIVFFILALGVCSLGLLFNVFASFGMLKEAIRNKEWKIIIGFGIILYRVLVLTLTLLWAYDKKDELTPFSNYSDLETEKKPPATANKIVFNQFMVTTTIISLAIFILTFFAVLGSSPLVFVAYLFIQYIVNMALPVLTKFGVEVDNLLRMDYQKGINELNYMISHFYNSNDPKERKEVREYFYKNVNRARTDRSEFIPQSVIDRMEQSNDLFNYIEYGIHTWKK